VRRILAALLFAISIWVSGLGYGGGIQEAHAVSVKFTGVEVVAKSPSYGDNMVNSASQDMMQIALQKRQAFLNEKQQQQIRRPGVGITSPTTMAATLLGIVAVSALSTGAGIALVRKTKSVAADRSTVDDEVKPPLIQEHQENFEEATIPSQSPKEIQAPESITDDASSQEIHAPESSIDDALTGGESDFIFMSLVAMSVAASYSMYMP
jgi:hypothetical protein